MRKGFAFDFFSVLLSCLLLMAIFARYIYTYVGETLRTNGSHEKTTVLYWRINYRSAYNRLWYPRVKDKTLKTTGIGRRDTVADDARRSPRLGIVPRRYGESWYFVIRSCYSVPFRSIPFHSVVLPCCSRSFVPRPGSALSSYTALESRLS